VTTAALAAYLDGAGVTARLSELTREDALGAAMLRELRAQLYAHDLPPALGGQIAGAAARLRERAGELELLAVRSSAADEDSGQRSFAGLHETVLGVAPAGIEAAVRKCWASLWSDASVAYRRAHGLPVADAAMAVVVQALVPAEASALAFTADPVTGATDGILVQATHGLGAPLVAGDITPDTAVIEKDGLVVSRVEPGEKSVRVDARPGGGLLRARTPDAQAAVGEDELKALAEIALAIERELGTPVDVEAALAGGRWYVVQARPITALPARAAAARASRS
jgi:pyruvate,water dikinase